MRKHSCGNSFPAMFPGVYWGLLGFTGTDDKSTNGLLGTRGGQPAKGKKIWRVGQVYSENF